MHEIASTRVRYGFWRIYVLIRRDGWHVNHKRIYRLYKEEGLNLRSKRPHRRKAAAHRLERPTLTTRPARACTSSRMPYSMGSSLVL